MAAPTLRTALRTAANARLSGFSYNLVHAPVMAAGPSRLQTYHYPTSPVRPLTTTTTRWKKATKGSTSKAAKPRSRTEVENVDYENPELDQTLAKTGAKMEKAVEWAKLVVFESVERGRGRVSPCG